MLEFHALERVCATPRKKCTICGEHWHVIVEFKVNEFSRSNDETFFCSQNKNFFCTFFKNRSQIFFHRPPHEKKENLTASFLNKLFWLVIEFNKLLFGAGWRRSNFFKLKPTVIKNDTLNFRVLEKAARVRGLKAAVCVSLGF